MLYSVTASHYDCNVKGLLLGYTIDSLVKNGVEKCLVSISFNNEEHYLEKKNEIDNLKKKFGLKLKIYIHHKKLYQFQHLQYLCDIMSSFVIPYDKIIFCDDDDIMFKMPPVYEHDVISGFQYLTGFFEDDENNFNDYEKIIELTKSPNINFWRKVDDFSGYVCNYKLFKEFFELNTFNFFDELILNTLSLQMIDLKFMKYLDNFNVHKPTSPFIYHRQWSVKDRPIQQWRQNCIIDANMLFDDSAKNCLEDEATDKLKNNSITQHEINDSLKKIKRILTIGIVCATIAIAVKYR